MRPKLLVIELWGVGDLAIATPFLQKAVEQFDVTLAAKPYALDLKPRFWPSINVVTFNAPWTAFDRKYHLTSWPWKEMLSVRRRLSQERFDVALSARWDPRDHFLMWLSGAKARLGFPRTGSRLLLTHPLLPPSPGEHRYENWRVIASALNLEMKARDKLALPDRGAKTVVFIHTGAGQPVRVWPLDRFHKLASKLRAKGFQVRIACNPEQRDWWLAKGEKEVATPLTITQLMAIMADAAIFIGNDSGPGHLAAFCGIPTFTFFGPQLPEWFVPLHPKAEWYEGKTCPYRPCSDYCRFAEPYCMVNVTEEEAWTRIQDFVRRNLG